MQFRIPASISIHAPVKGATGVLARIVPELGISIHAPVKGATVSGFPFGTDD